MTCKLCTENPIPQGTTYQTDKAIITEVWSPRKCAFDEKGNFTSSNWNCATICHLRPDNFDENVKFSGDQSCYIKPVGTGEFLILGWYKGRGKTEVAFILYEETTYPLTLKWAEKILEGKAPNVLES